LVEIPDGLIEIEDGIVTYVGDWKNEQYDRLLDFRDSYVVPGLIDIHTHGAKGYDPLKKGGIRGLSEFLVSKGITSFLPTIYTTSYQQTKESVKTITQEIDNGVNGAIPLGINLEGPYLNPRKAGALNSRHMRAPNIDEVKDILEASRNNLRIVTLAPELDGALELIIWLTSKGIVPAAGHTEASYDEMMKAIDGGLHHATHLFNQMNGLHHREPGVVGAALASENVTVELIADCFHIHPAVLKIVSKIKGPQKTAIVSDSIPAAGLQDGMCEFGEFKTQVFKGKSLLDSGQIAGSTINLSDAVRNMVNFGDVKIHEVLSMASSTPAKIAGVSEKKGLLAPGMDADIVILDRELFPKLTIVGGKIAYRRI
jgi:N-acetylglucosamine-6-phosphate deacetylase